MSRRASLRRERRPHPAQPARLPAAHQGPARATRTPCPASSSRSTAAATRLLVRRGAGRARRHRDEGPRARAARASSSATGRAGRRHRRRPGRPGPHRAGRAARVGAAAHRRRHRPGRARHRRQRRPAGHRHRAGRPRAAAAADRPVPRRGLRRRAGPAAGADQGRPGRPDDRSSTTTRRSRCPTSSPSRGPVEPGVAGLEPLHERLVGRVSVFVGHSGVGKSTLVNAPGAGGRAGRRRGQRRHRPRPAHLDLGHRAAAARTAGLGRSTRRACARSGWPTSTPPGSSTPSPTSSRAPPSARGACTHDEAGVRARRLGRRRAGRPGRPLRLESLRRLLRARSPEPED